LTVYLELASSTNADAVSKSIFRQAILSMAENTDAKGVQNIAENFFRHCNKQTNTPVKGKITGMYYNIR